MKPKSEAEQIEAVIAGAFVVDEAIDLVQTRAIASRVFRLARVSGSREALGEVWRRLGAMRRAATAEQAIEALDAAIRMVETVGKAARDASKP